MGQDPRGSGCCESTPAEPESHQMAALPWAGSSAGHCHLSSQWARCLPDPKPPAWLLGRFPRAACNRPVPPVRASEGPGRPEERQLPSSGPWASGGDCPWEEGGGGGVQGVAHAPGAHRRRPSHPQPAAACAPRGAPQHGDRGLSEELPALPHGRGPPRVLPASARPGPSHRRGLLPPQLPGPTPLPAPGLQVRRPASPATRGQALVRDQTPPGVDPGAGRSPSLRMSRRELAPGGRLSSHQPASLPPPFLPRVPWVLDS